LKKKLIYLSLFFFIAISFSSIVYNLIQNRVKEHLEAEKELVSVSYNTIIEAFRVHSNIIYFNKINTPEIKTILSSVYKTQSEEIKSKLRKKLYDSLYEMYHNMSDFQLKQLHFHLKNNESFLRFHRPDKFGDNLTRIRSTVEYVNKNKKFIHGFEEGRIYNGYRFVYPLEYDNEYLGSVETSVSMGNIIDAFRKEIHNDVDFIIKKSVVDGKVFEEERKNYKVCSTLNNFYHEKSISNGSNKLIESIISKYNKSDDLTLKLTKNKLFNFFITHEKDSYIVTFLPIKNKIEDTTVGYIIVVKQNSTFYKYNVQYVLFLGVLLFLTAMIIYFLYRIDKAKTKLIHKDAILNEVQKIGKLGYWELDIVTNELYLSDEVYTIFDLKEQIVGATYETLSNFVHPDDLDRVKKTYLGSVQNKVDYQMIYRIITKKNKVKYIEEECHHIINKESNIIQSLCTIRDITSLKEYQNTIEKGKEHFESLVSHIPDIVYRRKIDDNFTMLYLNEIVLNVTGYSINELKLNRVVSFASIVHPSDYQYIVKSVFNCLKSNKTSIKIEYRVIKKDKSIIWIEDYLEIIEDNGTKYIEGVLSDITLQKEAYNKLYKFIDTQDNIVILSDGYNIDFANRKFFKFLGFRNLEIFRSYHNCICEKFIEDDKFFNLSMVPEGKNWIEVIKTLPYSKRVVAILGDDFNLHAFSITINSYEDNLSIISFTDISQTMLLNIELEEKTIHDKLTNAYNREFFDKKYKSLLYECKQENQQFAISLLDIDHFKKVNDTYGHDIGDYVLKELVLQINNFSRKEDILIRWGGEEFILILKINSIEGLHKTLEHLRLSIAEHFFEHVHQITCSFGATIYKENEKIEETIKRADNALYEAKDNGRNKVVIKDIIYGNN